MPVNAGLRKGQERLLIGARRGNRLGDIRGSDKMQTISGRCFCGAIGFEIEQPVVACVTCHCESCRRQCSAPMTAYVGVVDGQWRWTKGRAKVFQSSPQVERGFCGDCGTPLSFWSSDLSGMIHFYLACLEGDHGLTPTLHVAGEERVSWLKLSDGLPVHEGPDYLEAGPPSLPWA